MGCWGLESHTSPPVLGESRLLPLSVKAGRLLRQTCLHCGGCRSNWHPVGSGHGREFLNSLLDPTHWHVPERRQRSWICHALGCHPVWQETFWAVSWSCRAALRSFQKSVSGFSDHKAVQGLSSTQIAHTEVCWPAHSPCWVWTSLLSWFQNAL